MNVPDMMLGPKGVRLWLLFRGFSGYASSHDMQSTKYSLFVPH